MIVLIIVEGSTEVKFVQQVLGPYLCSAGLEIRPITVRTGVNPSGGAAKGGALSWPRVEREIRNQLARGRSIVTTMFDLYALPRQWPGNDAQLAGAAKAKSIEDALADHFSDHRFLPHLQLHEFEALLFSDLPASAAAMQCAPWSELEAEVDGLSPEEINDTPHGAPSKRLTRHHPPYHSGKPRLGPIAAAHIGVDAMRVKCPHFHQWIERLEFLTRGDNQK